MRALRIQQATYSFASGNFFVQKNLHCLTRNTHQKKKLRKKTLCMVQWQTFTTSCMRPSYIFRVPLLNEYFTPTQAKKATRAYADLNALVSTFWRFPRREEQELWNASELLYLWLFDVVIDGFSFSAPEDWHNWYWRPFPVFPHHRVSCMSSKNVSVHSRLQLIKTTATTEMHFIQIRKSSSKLQLPFALPPFLLSTTVSV